MKDKQVSSANNVIEYSSDFGPDMFSDQSIILLKKKSCPYCWQRTLEKVYGKLQFKSGRLEVRFSVVLRTRSIGLNIFYCQ